MPDNHGAFMRPPLRSVPVLALVLALGAPLAARADDAATAREHYQRGTSYYDLGKYPEAIKEFEAAYEIKNDPALLYNLAQSNRLAGNSEQALHFYRTYLRYVPKAKNRAEIEERITQLDQLVTQKNAGADDAAQPRAAAAAVGAPIQTPPPPRRRRAARRDAAVQPPPGRRRPCRRRPRWASPGRPCSRRRRAPAPANGHHKMILAGELTAGAGAVLFIAGAAFGASPRAPRTRSTTKPTNGPAVRPLRREARKELPNGGSRSHGHGRTRGRRGRGASSSTARHLAAQESVTVTPMASSEGAGHVAAGDFLMRGARLGLSRVWASSRSRARCAAPTRPTRRRGRSSAPRTASAPRATGAPTTTATRTPT